MVASQFGLDGVLASNLAMVPGPNQEIEVALIQLQNLAEWIAVEHLKIYLLRIVPKVHLWFNLSVYFCFWR